MSIQSIHQQRNKIQRQIRVAELRLAGTTNQGKIAKLLGVTQATISRDFKDLDVQFRERAAEDTAAARGIDLDRLDAMIEALWPEATSGKAKTWHVDRVLKCLERRAAILGVDAPVKREETLHLTFQRLAESVAKDLDLESAELVAEAERILAQAARP